MVPVLIFLLSGVRSEELSTPSSLLGPRNFNHHPYDQYLEETEPTKQGPVLFPNDAPPPPRPPLIVTSRPLTESIARSELNPELNNSIASPSQIKPEFRLKPDFKPEFRLKPSFRLKPEFLARVKDYRPFVLSTPLPEDYGPYAEVNKARLAGLRDDRYNEFEERTALPPIYKAIADHAKNKVLKLKHKPNHEHYNYQEKSPDHTRQYQHNDVRDDGESDYDHASNYAFSYRVKDHNTGDDFSHSQHSSGSATNGEYRVRLPDGRMQIVSYTADENGYNANVRYDDEDKTSGNRIDHHDLKQNRPVYDANRPVYDANRPVYDANRPVYDASRPVYDANRPVYDANRHDYDENRHDLNRNRQDYDANRHDYDTNRQDYKLNYDYAQNRDYKPTERQQHNAPVKEEYNQYGDLSKEYYNTDYSLEYDGKDDNYEPHRSKFTTFVPKGSNLGTIVVPNVANRNSIPSTTVRPSYEELKPLFVTKNLYEVQPTQNYLKNVEFNVPSTTPNSINFEGTTEHVVIIGRKNPNLYTNIKKVPLTVTPPTVTSTSDYLTPRSYLVSTIAGLKAGQKPVLSNSFIDRINKYLTFT